MARPRTPKDVADLAALNRIALLAGHILITSRQPGRGAWDSERGLRAWLTDDGYSFANDDLAPALAMLEASGRIGRAATKKNVPRSGWLITSTVDGPESPDDVEPTAAVAAPDEPVEDSSEARAFELVQAVIRALQTGNGRSNRCKVDELPERLTEDGVTFDPADLPEVLTRLEDCGQIIRVQRQPYSVFAQSLVVNGRHSYDQTDALAASVCSSIKRRGDRFESDRELCSWLDEDGVSYTSEALTAALRQLGETGRISRPVQEWGLPTPGIYVEPRVYSE